MSNFDAIRGMRAGYDNHGPSDNDKLSAKDWAVGTFGFIGLLTFNTWVGISNALSVLLIIGIPLGAGAALVDKGILWLGIPLFVFGPVVAMALCGSLVQMCIFPIMGLLCLWLVLSMFGIHSDVQGYIASAPFVVGVLWVAGFMVGVFKWCSDKVMAR